MTLSGLEEFIIFGFMPLIIGVFAGTATSRVAEQTVTGKVTIPRLPSLPDDAVVIIELVEQRRGETVVPALARETIRWPGLTSQKFAIRFDPSLIRPMAYYAVQARIIAGGKVWFETDYPQPAAPLSGDPMHLALVPAS
jgi:putative lipoprotein